MKRVVFKRLILIFTVALIAVFAFCLAACDDPQPPKKREYTVTYYDADSFIDARKVKEGAEIPDLPMSKPNNRFNGWFFEDGRGINGVTVQSDITVYARWTRLYTLVLNYGNNVPSEEIKATAGEKITLPDLRVGNKAILGWTDGANAYEPASVFTMPPLNVTLTAEWAEIVTITYVYDGGEIATEVTKGSTLKLPNVSADGKTVYSWTDGDNTYLAGEQITVVEDMRLTAMFASTYTITYDVDGGKPVAPVTKSSGEEIILPLPEKEGYNFIGWRIGNTVYPAGATFTMGAENVTAKALWEEITFAVTLTDWDGYPFEVLWVGYGEDVIFPELAICSLAEFAGWSSAGKNVLQNTVISATYNYKTPIDEALYTFTLIDGGYAISAGNANLLTGTELVLPASYRGLPVKEVASSTAGTFKGFEQLKKVTLTSSYERLGNKAFQSLTNLNTVILNANLKSIGNDCFYDCYALTNLVLNEGLQTIGSRAFYDIGISDYYIPASVQSIGDLAFFYYPSNNLNPANCYKSITVAPESKSFASLNGVLYSKDFTKLVCYPANKEGNSFTLPSTVTTLGTYCFSFARNIQQFSFGESKVKTIERVAFNSTTFDIVLPDSMTEIQKDMLELAYGDVTLSRTLKVIPSFAFQSFYGKNVYIPANVETIEEYAFHHCPGVVNVYFAEGCKVKTISAYAFENCPNLTTVNLHEGLKEIGAYAFSVSTIGTNQNKLAEITFPASLEKIGEYAFSYSAALVSVRFADGSKISEISLGAFGSCYKLKNVSFGNTDQKVDLTFGVRAFALSDDLSNFTFPANLVSIGDECFAGSESQAYGYHSPKITQLELPARVREVGNGAFSILKSLTSFKTAAGSQLERVGSSVFHGCAKLASVIMPESLRYMGSNVFAGCSELEEVQILSTTMNFEFVDGGLYNTEAKSLEFAKVNADGVFTVREGTLTIVDSCFANTKELKVINIAASVNTIGNRAFYNCENLEEVNIPKASVLESIGDYAFASSPMENVPSIPFTDIYLPKTLKSIGSSAFFNTAISVPLYFSAELIKLDGYAFAYCPNIPSITFAENSKLTTIGAAAFYKCTSLTEVIFGEGSSLQSLGSTVFNGCSNLTTVVFTSKTVVTLGTNVFGNVGEQLSVYVPEDLLTSYINGTGWLNYTSYLKPIK